MTLVERISEALAKEQGPPRVILLPILEALDPHEVAAALPQAGEQRWILRDHLAQRWGRSSSVFQEACFFEVAEAVTAKLQPRTVIGRIVGEGGSLNDDVIRHHLASPERAHRLGAIQGTSVAHLPLLERRFEEEPDEEVRTAIAQRGKVLAGEMGAQASRFLDGPERIVRRATLFFLGPDSRERWMRFERLASVLGADDAAVRAAIEGVARPDAGDYLVQGFLVGALGVRHMTSTSVWTRADELVAQGRIAELRDHVGTLAAGKPPKGITLPALTWADGVPLSDAELRLRLALPATGHQSEREAVAAAIDRGLDRGSIQTLVGWWLEDKKRQKAVALCATDGNIDALVALEGLPSALKRSGLGATWGDRSVQLTYLRMLAEHGASARNDLRNTLRQRGGLLDALTDSEPAFLGRAEWQAHLRHLVEGWLRRQTRLWLPELRHWLAQPLREVCDGLVLRAGEVSVVLRTSEGCWLEGPSLDPNALLTVQHPITWGSARWPEATPDWQRQRPCYTEADLPPMGEQGAEVSFKDWTARAESLTTFGSADTGTGGVSKTVCDPTVELHHSGYGGGYGGKVAQRLQRIAIKQQNPAVVSEAVWDVRRIMGVDPCGAP